MESLLVRVFRGADEEINPTFIGRTGRVVELDFDHICGNIGTDDCRNTTDPLILVEFDDGTCDNFWLEELEFLLPDGWNPFLEEIFRREIQPILDSDSTYIWPPPPTATSLVRFYSMTVDRHVRHNPTDDGQEYLTTFILKVMYSDGHQRFLRFTRDHYWNGHSFDDFWHVIWLSEPKQ